MILSQQQKITAISKASCGVTEGLSILLLFFSCRRAPLDDYRPSLINSKASVEDHLYVILYAALRLQLA
jgi:hypothetical protein